MFKSILIVATLTLSGCSHIWTPEDPELSTANAVVENTKSVCNFAPELTSILALLGLPGAPAANVLVSEICAEVAKIPRFENATGDSQETVVVRGQNVPGTLASN